MRQLAKLTWVEIKLFARDPLTMVFSLAFPVFVLIIMAGVFGNTPDPEGKVWAGVGPMDYLVPGFCGLSIAAIGFIALPIHLALYRERGVLRRLRSSSIWWRRSSKFMKIPVLTMWKKLCRAQIAEVAVLPGAGHLPKPVLRRMTWAT